MAAQHGAGPASVPFPQPLPESAPAGGRRVDGRGYEEFRSVCEHRPAPPGFPAPGRHTSCPTRPNQAPPAHLCRARFSASLLELLQTSFSLCCSATGSALRLLLDPLLVSAYDVHAAQSCLSGARCILARHVGQRSAPDGRHGWPCSHEDGGGESGHGFSLSGDGQH